MNFVLKGKEYSLTREDVQDRMRGVKPGGIQKHYVIINGKRYSPKHVVHECLGIALIEFTTMDAAGILRRLGFELNQI